MASVAGDPALLAGVCVVLGLLIGSFLNVVVFRLPRMMQRQWAADAVDLLTDVEIRTEIGLSHPDSEVLDPALQRVAQQLRSLGPLQLSTPRSTCPRCGHLITPLENVPVLSWLVLRGRCRACAARISVRYPLVEVATAFLFGAASVRFGWTPELGTSFILIAFLIALSFIDADTMLLPDSLTLPLLWMGLVAAAAGIGFVSTWQSVVGAVVGYCAFWFVGTAFRLVRGIEGMGAGDYKLLAALGAWFGWPALLPIVLISAAVGSVVGLSLMACRRASLLTKLPFGVYLAPAGIIMIFFAREITSALLPGVH